MNKKIVKNDSDDKNPKKVKKSPTSSQININVHHVQTFFTMNTTKNLKMNVATAMKSLLEQGKENSQMHSMKLSSL